MYTYTTTYAYISMPIKVLYTYENEIKLLVGGGISPQLFLSYNQEIEWKDKVDATGKESIQRKNGYSPFALSAAVNLGVQWKFSDNFSLLFLPEYRIQLTNTYIETHPHNHFGRALGFDIGLTYKL